MGSVKKFVRKLGPAAPILAGSFLGPMAGALVPSFGSGIMGQALRSALTQGLTNVGTQKLIGGKFDPRSALTSAVLGGAGTALSGIGNSAKAKNFFKTLSDDKKTRSDLVAGLREVDHQIKHIQLKIDGSLSCPKCDHEFDPTDDTFDVASAGDDIADKKVIREGIVKDGKEVGQRIKDTSASIESLNVKISRLKGERSALLDEKGDIESDMQDCHNSIKGNRDRIKLYLMEIEVLRSKSDVDTATPLRNRIKSTKAKLDPIEARLAVVTDEWDELNVQLDVFVRFKSYLANLSLKSMEGLANDFLEDFGSDIFIQLNSTKKLANGQDREKIDSTLVRHGLDIGSFNKRSGGEKAAINLAFAKTLSHLINLNAGENKGLNLLVIDEILDSTDAEGMTKIVKALEKAGETAILITHIPLPASVGKPILVVKENDVSRLEDYDGV